MYKDLTAESEHGQSSFVISAGENCEYVSPYITLMTEAFTGWFMTCGLKCRTYLLGVYHKEI